MSIQSLSKLKGWFKKGNYPTESQFADLIDSLRHKEDPIEMSEVRGLTNAVNNKLNSSEGKLFFEGLAAAEEQIRKLQQETRILRANLEELELKFLTLTDDEVKELVNEIISK